MNRNDSGRREHLLDDDSLIAPSQSGLAPGFIPWFLFNGEATILVSDLNIRHSDTYTRSLVYCCFHSLPDHCACL